MKFTIKKTPNLFFVHLKLMLANLLRAHNPLPNQIMLQSMLHNNQPK